MLQSGPACEPRLSKANYLSGKVTRISGAVPLTEASYLRQCVQSCQSGRIWFVLSTTVYLLNRGTDWPMLDNTANRSNRISENAVNCVCFYN